MDLEVHEVMLMEEQERGLHPHDGRDLSVELEEIRAHMDWIEGERAAESRPTIPLTFVFFSHCHVKKEKRVFRFGPTISCKWFVSSRFISPKPQMNLG
jgi:hypothetical protein